MSKGAVIALVVVAVVVVVGVPALAMASPKPVILPDIGPPPPPPPSFGKFVAKATVNGLISGANVVKTALVGTDPSKSSFIDWVKKRTTPV